MIKKWIKVSLSKNFSKSWNDPQRNHSSKLCYLIWANIHTRSNKPNCSGAGWHSPCLAVVLEQKRHRGCGSQRARGELAAGGNRRKRKEIHGSQYQLREGVYDQDRRDPCLLLLDRVFAVISFQGHPFKGTRWSKLSRKQPGFLIFFNFYFF